MKKKLIDKLFYYIINQHNIVSQKLSEITYDTVKKAHYKFVKFFIGNGLGMIVVYIFGLISFNIEGITFWDSLTGITVFCYIVMLLWSSIYTVFQTSLLSNTKIVTLVIGYLYTVISFSIIYQVYYLYNVESFYISEYLLSNGKLSPIDFIYFSFVSITTLGYGDISPVSGFAQLLVILELIIGLTFLVLGISSIFSNKENDESISKLMKQIYLDKEK